MPRTAIAILLGTLALTSCTPVVDVAFYNATGQPIVIRNDASPRPGVSIPPGAAVPADILVLRSGYPNQFTITTPSHAWVYQHHLRLLGSVRRDYWEHGPSDSRRLHVSIDSRGRIHLLSSSGTPVPQPAGFPISPDVQKKS